MPIWLRVSGAIAAALVVAVVGSMLLGAASIDGVDHVGPAIPSHVRPSH